jgi:hypothetical protein
MMGQQEKVEVSEISLEFDQKVFAQIQDLAERHQVSIEQACQMLIAAGMISVAANAAGYDVVGHMGDGTVIPISQAWLKD